MLGYAYAVAWLAGAVAVLAGAVAWGRRRAHPRPQHAVPLDRDSLRVSEAAGLTWANLDRDRGAITLDENKTDDARAWAVSGGEVAAEVPASIGGEIRSDLPPIQFAQGSPPSTEGGTRTHKPFRVADFESEEDREIRVDREPRRGVDRGADDGSRRMGGDGGGGGRGGEAELGGGREAGMAGVGGGGGARGEVVVHLIDAMRAAVVGGDVEAVRVCYEALGRLMEG